jgi:hypothetical protein
MPNSSSERACEHSANRGIESSRIVTQCTRTHTPDPQHVCTTKVIMWNAYLKNNLKYFQGFYVTRKIQNATV